MTQQFHTDSKQSSSSQSWSESRYWSQRVLDFFLVVAESMLTLILRFDAQLRQAAYPLAQAQVVVEINTYLPNERIYLSFSTKGILLDADLPIQKDQADIMVNAYSFQVILAILSDKEAKIDALQCLGDEQKVQWLKHFLQTLSVSHLLAQLLALFDKNKKETPSQEEQEANKQQKITDYQEKIAKLEQSNDQLMTDNGRLVAQLAELKSRQNVYTYLSIAFAIISVVAVVMLMMK